MRKLKGITYDPVKDADVIDYIDSQPNGSQYILRLVRKDMQNQNTDIEETIMKCIEKFMAGKEFVASATTNNSLPKITPIDVNDIKNILDI